MPVGLLHNVYLLETSCHSFWACAIAYVEQRIDYTIGAEPYISRHHLPIDGYDSRPITVVKQPTASNSPVDFNVTFSTVLTLMFILRLLTTIAGLHI